MSWFTNRTQEIRDAEKRERNDITRAKRQLAAGEISREEYDAARSQIAQKKASGDYVTEAASTALADNKNKLNNTGSENREPANTKSADTNEDTTPATSTTAPAESNNESNNSFNVSKFAKPVMGVAGALTANNMLGPAKDQTGASAAWREVSGIYDKQAGDEQRNMQANQQIANRNYRSEADRNAASTAAAMNAQNVANLGAAAGSGAAALQRQVVAPDYNVTMNRSDTQRQQGVENQRAMYNAQKQSAALRGDANQRDYMARVERGRNAATAYATSGGFGLGDSATGGDNTVQQSQTNEPAVNESAEPANTEAEATPAPDTGAAQSAGNTVNIDGQDYDTIDIQNGTNAYFNVQTRRMDNTNTPVQGTADYNKSGREEKAITLANTLRSKFGDYTDPASAAQVNTYIQGLREQLTGSKNINNNADWKAMAESAVPTQFKEELGGAMRS